MYGLGFETLYTFLFAHTEENNEVSIPEFSSLFKLLLKMDRESLNFFAMKEESEQMITARGFAIVDHNRDEKLSFAEVQMFVQRVEFLEFIKKVGTNTRTSYKEFCF